MTFSSGMKKPVANTKRHPKGECMASVPGAVGTYTMMKLNVACPTAKFARTAAKNWRANNESRRCQDRHESCAAL